MSKKFRSFMIATLGLLTVVVPGCDDDILREPSAVHELSACTVQCGAGAEIAYEGASPACACAPLAVAGEVEEVDREIGEPLFGDAAPDEPSHEFTPLDDVANAAADAEAAYGSCGVNCGKGSCSYSGPCPRCWCGIEGVPHCKKNC